MEAMTHKNQMSFPARNLHLFIYKGFSMAMLNNQMVHREITRCLYMDLKWWNMVKPSNFMVEACNILQ